MNKILLAVGALFFTSCSISNPVEITATAKKDGVAVQFSSKKPVQNMNQGTTEKPVITGFFFRTFDQSGKRVGDDVFLGFNSSNYMKDLKKSKEGSVFIEYREIYSTLQDWYYEKPDEMNKIRKIQVLWKPFFSNEFKIPVECSKQEDKGIICASTQNP